MRNQGSPGASAGWWMLCLMALALVFPHLARGQGRTGQIQQPLNVALATVWQGPIPVCWISAGDPTEKQWVRNAVAATWEAASAVRFVGWGQCAAKSGGIRIQISDQGPHTKRLGTQLNGLNPGMVLNFTFNNWGVDCAPAGARRSCIESIGVHEFGHALGFAHEQNRADTPGTCRERQGSDGNWNAGVWDLSSTMNYCNPSWNNGGALSALDRAGARQVYGSPQNWESAFGAFCSHANGSLQLGDFNGDKRSDLLCHDRVDGRNWIAFATANQAQPYSLDAAYQWSSAANWCGHVGAQLLVGDFNGDGRSDLLCHDTRTGHKWVSLTPINTRPTATTTWQSDMQGWCSHSGAQLLVADFNGDKRSDMLCHDPRTGRKWIAYATSGGSFKGTDWESPMNAWCSHSGASLRTGDFNGDGRADLLCHDVNNGRKWIAFADTAGHFSGTSWESPMNRWCSGPQPLVGFNQQLLIADMDGNGKDDLVCHNTSNGWKWIAYARNDGTFAGTDWEGPYARWCSHAGAQFMVGRVNSDKSADFICHDTRSGRKWVSYPQ